MSAPATGDPFHSSDDSSRAFLLAIVSLTFVMNTVGRGVTETFAVFLLPVQKEFGVSRADIASTYSIYMLGYALAAPLASCGSGQADTGRRAQSTDLRVVTKPVEDVFLLTGELRAVRSFPPTRRASTRWSPPSYARRSRRCAKN